MFDREINFHHKDMEGEPQNFIAQSIDWYTASLQVFADLNAVKFREQKGN